MTGNNPANRFAFVLGNTDYVKIKSLPNAVSDAELVAKKLGGLGFDVAIHTNLDFSATKRAFEEFLNRKGNSGKSGTVLFYFAGHGYQEDGKNYLVPLDIDGSPFGAVPLQDWIKDISTVSDQRLIFLDACREYFDTELVESELGRSRSLPQHARPHITGGLADFGATDDTFISFSAAPGEPAYDGQPGSKNSPYAEALTRFIEEVDLPLTVMMARVRNSVSHAMKGNQQTWDSSSLNNSFFFNPSSLLFLLGNILALIASFVALTIVLVVMFETAVAEFVPSSSAQWVWMVLGLLIYVFSVMAFLIGVGRAYGRVRGGQSEWQVEGRFSLLRLSSASFNGAIGGFLGSVIASAAVTIPYWWEWRNKLPWYFEECGLKHWADPKQIVECPRLGQLLVEGELAGIFILVVVGFFTMHVSEWMRRDPPIYSAKLNIHWRILLGAVLGGVFAGIVIGVTVTSIFGALDRPFFYPVLALPLAVSAVGMTAFCIANYSLERFTLNRLLWSAVGAGLGTIAAAVVIAVNLGVLQVTIPANDIYEWAKAGFSDKSIPSIFRYLYLASSGAVYGVTFGVGFGVSIGVARLFSNGRPTFDTRA